jgi:hypothetical protein
MSQKDIGLQIAQEQNMAIFLEPAAAAAGDTDRAGGLDFLIDPPVHFKHLTAEWFGHSLTF